ncbi:MAG: NAD(P)-dependent alcohol dehydrogenase, partial [Bacilli bacterium]
MKAVVYHAYGSPEVLKLTEAPVPSPGKGEVLIKVAATAVNSWDWDLLRGQPFITRIEGLRKPKYPVLGADVAGIVTAVGPDVRGFSVGDAVFGDLSGCGWGGFAEYVVADTGSLTLKPREVGFIDAAALPQAGVLALQALQVGGVWSVEDSGMRDSDAMDGLHKKRRSDCSKKVCINGAGGGVGTIGLQLAKLCGAHVTCVDRGDKLSTLLSLGADCVVDYTKEDFCLDEAHYDVILDVVGNRDIAEYKRALRAGGTYVMIGGPIGKVLKVAMLGSMIGRAEQKHFKVLVHKTNAADQQTLVDLVSHGELSLVIDQLFSLEQVPDAIRQVGEGRAIGKVVVCI